MYLYYAAMCVLMSVGLLHGSKTGLQNCFPATPRCWGRLQDQLSFIVSSLGHNISPTWLSDMTYKCSTSQ